jgi:hypothetical protein
VAAGTGTTTPGSGTGSSAGTGSGGGTGTGVVPAGFPHTGEGGASLSHNDGLIGLGVLALVGSGTLAAVAIRRRMLLADCATRTPE